MYVFFRQLYELLSNIVFSLHTALMLLLSVCMCACSPHIANRGNFLTQDDFKEIIVGKSQTTDVIRVLGEPSVQLNDGLWWLYIGSRHDMSKTLGRSDVERSVYMLVFDKSGKLIKIENNNAQLQRNITKTNKKPTMLCRGLF